MSSLLKTLKEIKRVHREGRRQYRHGDPVKGIEYNKFSTHYMVSRYVYGVDIARTPQIVKDADEGYQRVDVHRQAWKANLMRPMVDYYAARIKGRGR